MLYLVDNMRARNQIVKGPSLTDNHDDGYASNARGTQNEGEKLPRVVVRPCIQHVVDNVDGDPRDGYRQLKREGSDETLLPLRARTAKVRNPQSQRGLAYGLPPIRETYGLVENGGDGTEDNNDESNPEPSESVAVTNAITIGCGQMEAEPPHRDERDSD